MKAVVLVGGEGTRLRPLTETVPKPLLPLVDRPILDHLLDHLVGHGVREVIMSSPYLEDTFHPFIEARGGEPGDHLGHGAGGAGDGWRDRERPRPHLGDDSFLALNGDILTDLDLTAMLARPSTSGGAAATIATAPRGGRARLRARGHGSETGRITEFREKPTDLDPR